MKLYFEVQTNARFYGSLFGSILGMSAASYVRGSCKIYSAAIGGFYGMCIGDYLSTGLGLFFKAILPTAAVECLDIDVDQIAGFTGGIIAGITATQAGIAVAREIDPESIL